MRKTLSISAAVAAATCLMLGAAQAQTTMSSADVSVAKERIEVDHKAAKMACDKLAGNAKDICTEEADGREKVAKAELEYRRTGKPEDMAKVREARAEATFEVAEERCDDRSGDAKDLCMKEAEAAHVRAKADARLGARATGN